MHPVALQDQIACQSTPKMRCGERMRQCPVGSIVSRPNCAIHPATPAGNWEDRPDERRSHGPLAVEEEEMVEEKAWQVVMEVADMDLVRLAEDPEDSESTKAEAVEMMAEVAPARMD